MATPYLHDWIDWQENVGRKLNQRIEEILTAQGKHEKYSLEDVKLAAARAKQELGIQ